MDMSPRATRRRSRPAIAAVVGALAINGLCAAVIGTPAKAAVGDLSCTVSATATFNPPLRPGGSTTVTGHALLQNCVSPSGRFPNIKSGVYYAPALQGTAAPGVDPCGMLLTLRGAVEIDWNTGQVSHGDGVLNTNPLNGTTLLGRITYDGPHNKNDPFYDDVATVVPAAATVNPDCADAGIKLLTVDLAAYLIN